MAIENRVSAEALLVQVARMATHAGLGIARGAGSGYVGMINGLTVKLATHWGERGSSKPGMDKTHDACDVLRDNLQQAAELLLSGKSKAYQDALTNVRRLLGLDQDVPEGQHRPLITRQIALDVVTAIRDAAHSDNLASRLEDVTGEATIKHSRADQFLDNHADEFRRMDTLQQKVGQALNYYLPGAANETTRKAVLDRISQSFVFRDGEMKLSNLLGNSLKEDGQNPVSSLVRENDTLADTIGTLLTSVKDSGGEYFQKALAKLYTKLTAAEADPAWSVETLVQSLVPEFKEVELPLIPSDRTEGAAWKKPFAALKTTVTTLYPKGTEDGGRCYQTLLLNAAADDAGTTVENLTPNQLADYIERNWETRFMNTSIWAFLDKVAVKERNNNVLTGSPAMLDKNQFLEQLRAGNELTGNIFRMMNTGVAFYFIPANNYERGGCLMSKHEETFTFGTQGHEATSTVTPKHTFNQGKFYAQLANLSETELSRTNPQTNRKEVLFHGLRFGDCNLKGNGTNMPRQFAHYGQLVQQTLLADKVRRESLHEGDVIDLPMVRLDMSDLGLLRNCAPEYHLTVDGKNVTVRPHEMHFRVATDSAALVTLVDGSKKWVMMSKEMVEQNDRALEALRKSAAQSDDPQVRALADQLNTYWTTLKRRHADDDGNLQLFQGYGAEMMQFGARIAVLTSKLGNIPSFNCTGGRDRTGLMDVECKTLALHLAEGGALPEIKATEDDLRSLRTTVRDKSGNQDIAREILLNDVGMYTNQVGGCPGRLGDAGDVVKDVPKMPDWIRSNDGTNEQVDWHSHGCRRSGLDALYIQPEIEV